MIEIIDIIYYDIIQWILIIFLLIRDIIGQISIQKVIKDLYRQHGILKEQFKALLSDLGVEMTNGMDIDNKNSNKSK